MVTIQTYLYSNIITAQFWDPTLFITRTKILYAQSVTIYQGIDNPIQVLVKNQDQRSIDLAGRMVQVDIQNPNTQSTEYSLAVNITDATRGRGNFIITRDIANGLQQRQYKLTFRVITAATNQEQPLFVDDNYGVPLDLIVKPGYYSDMPPQDGEQNDFITIDGGTTP